MIKLWEFFSSFDKLMKEKLVKAFYWLALTIIVLIFIEVLFDVIGLDWLNNVVDFFLYFASFLAFVVALRLICEMAIALFRINDNLSPDGGKSETADIDPLNEARKAAEAAAIRAREATKTTFEKTSAATKSTFDKASDATKQSFEKTPFHHDDVRVHEPGPNPARTPQVTSTTRKTKATTTYKAAAPKKTAATSKTRAKKAPTVKKSTTPKPSAPKKKAPTRKTPTRKTTTKKSTASTKYNKDGTVKRKPGPKPGSSSKYTKDGRLKKKPGPKSK